jgi:hypothetical protein
MKRLLLVLTLFTTFTGLGLALVCNPQPAMAASSAPAASAAAASPSTVPAVLCLPGIYLYDPGDCLPAGPSSYLTHMAQKGITFPPPPLSYTPVDQSLGKVDYQYAEVTNTPAPIFGSLDQALQGNKKGTGQSLDGNFVFISYTSLQEVGGKKLYEIAPGQFLTGAYLSRIGALPPARGLTFTSTPPTAFGWVLTYFAQNPQVETKRTPGNQNQDYTGRLLNLYDIVQVFGEEKVGQELWYMIGPDEWILGRYIARVIPNTTPPAGVTGDRWIEVNLFEQTLSVYDQRQLVFATLIASGAEPFWTQPGVFQITQKLDTTPMTGSFEANRSDAYYLEDVPWTMYFDGARALHGAYWRAKMGFRQSHGCVNMTVGDSHWLYDWANLGDWVYVWDPSGETPTDPDQYKAGGY